MRICTLFATAPLRMILPLTIAILCFGCGGLNGSNTPDSPNTDSAKASAIDEMYAGYKEEFSDVPDMSIEELLVLRRDDESLIILDVREPEEQAVSMIPGAITKSVLEQNPEAYRDRQIVTYCTIGYRSGLYAQQLRKDGFDAINLRGSILSWAHAGQSLENTAGETRRVHVYGRKWDLLPEGYEAEW